MKEEQKIESKKLSKKTFKEEPKIEQQLDDQIKDNNVINLETNKIEDNLISRYQTIKTNGNNINQEIDDIKESLSQSQNVLNSNSINNNTNGNIEQNNNNSLQISSAEELVNYHNSTDSNKSSKKSKNLKKQKNKINILDDKKIIEDELINIQQKDEKLINNISKASKRQKQKDYDLKIKSNNIYVKKNSKRKFAEKDKSKRLNAGNSNTYKEYPFTVLKEEIQIKEKNDIFEQKKIEGQYSTDKSIRLNFYYSNYKNK